MGQVRPFKEDNNFLFNYFKKMNLGSDKDENKQKNNSQKEKKTLPKKTPSNLKTAPKKNVTPSVNQPFKPTIKETKVDSESDEEEPQMPTQQSKTLSRFNRN